MRDSLERKQSLFQRLFTENQQAVFAFYLGHGLDREDAKDLLLESFAKAWLKIVSLERLEERERRYWLFGISRNLLVDFGRRREVRNRAIETVRQDKMRAGVQWAEPSSELSELIDSIQLLPSDQRLILSLSVLGEMTSEEIGEQTGKPAGTVRYELHQIRTKLRNRSECGRTTP